MSFATSENIEIAPFAAFDLSFVPSPHLSMDLQFARNLSLFPVLNEPLFQSNMRSLIDTMLKPNKNLQGWEEIDHTLKDFGVMIGSYKVFINKPDSVSRMYTCAQASGMSHLRGENFKFYNSGSSVTLEVQSTREDDGTYSPEVGRLWLIGIPTPQQTDKILDVYFDFPSLLVTEGPSEYMCGTSGAISARILKEDSVLARQGGTGRKVIDVHDIQTNLKDPFDQHPESSSKDVRKFINRLVRWRMHAAEALFETSRELNADITFSLDGHLGRQLGLPGETTDFCREFIARALSDGFYVRMDDWRLWLFSKY